MEGHPPQLGPGCGSSTRHASRRTTYDPDLPPTSDRILFAFGIGTAYYVTRRISGALVVTMVLHGAWDFSVFIQGHSVDGLADKPVAIGGIVMFPVVVISLLAVWRLHRDEGDVVEPGADQLAAFATAA